MKLTDLKPNEVIHCKTKEEAVRICGMIPNALPEWWKYYESDTCFNPQGAYAFVKHYKENGYTIYPSELFQDSSDLPDEITEEGLRARGFVVTDETKWVEMEKKNPKSIVSIKVNFLMSSDIQVRVFEYFDPGMPYYISVSNCHTLADIDHLIRLLGI